MYIVSWVATVGKIRQKQIFQGDGKVREFCKKLGKTLALVSLFHFNWEKYAASYWFKYSCGDVPIIFFCSVIFPLNVFFRILQFFLNLRGCVMVFLLFPSFWQSTLILRFLDCSNLDIWRQACVWLSARSYVFFPALTVCTLLMFTQVTFLSTLVETLLQTLSWLSFSENDLFWTFILLSCICPQASFCKSLRHVWFYPSCLLNIFSVLISLLLCPHCACSRGLLFQCCHKESIADGSPHPGCQTTVQWPRIQKSHLWASHLLPTSTHSSMYLKS